MRETSSDPNFERIPRLIEFRLKQFVAHDIPQSLRLEGWPEEGAWKAFGETAREFDYFFFRAKNLTERSIIPLGELEPILGTKGSVLQKKLTDQYYLIQNAIKDNSGYAALKQSGLNFRGMAQEYDDLAKLWEEKGLPLLKDRNDDVMEILTGLSSKAFNTQKTDRYLEKRLKKSITSQDPIVCKSETEERKEEVLTSLRQDVSEKAYENMQNASMHLRKIAAILNYYGDVFDKELLPLLQEIRTLGPTSDGLSPPP